MDIDNVTWKAFRSILLSTSLIVLSPACQSGSANTAKSPATPASFMTMWEVYEQCQSRDDLTEILSDVQALSVWAEQTQQPGTRTLSTMRSWIKPLPVRTAADPKAMVAECELHGAHLAEDLGLFPIAETFYKSVIERLPQDRYVYYVGEARARLKSLHQAPLVAQP
jgi:hypothetical protein